MSNAARQSETDIYIARLVGSGVRAPPASTTAKTTVISPPTGSSTTTGAAFPLLKEDVLNDRSFLFAFAIFCIMVAAALFVGIIYKDWLPFGLWPHMFAAIVACGSVLLLSAVAAFYGIFERDSVCAFYSSAALGMLAAAGLCLSVGLFADEGIAESASPVGTTWMSSCAPGGNQAPLCQLQFALNCTGWSQACNGNMTTADGCPNACDASLAVQSTTSCQSQVDANIHRFAPLVFFCGLAAAVALVAVAVTMIIRRREAFRAADARYKDRASLVYSGGPRDTYGSASSNEGFLNRSSRSI